MRFPQLHSHEGKKQDPNKVNAYHEIGHLIPKLTYRVVPDYVTLLPGKSMHGHVSGSFYSAWDMGHNWSECGPDYSILSSMGGIACGAIYSGFYHWVGARGDLNRTEHIATINNWEFDRLLGAWKRTHELLNECWDLVEMASRRLFQDKVLTAEFIEEEMLFNTLKEIKTLPY